MNSILQFFSIVLVLTKKKWISLIASTVSNRIGSAAIIVITKIPNLHFTGSSDRCSGDLY